MASEVLIWQTMDLFLIGKTGHGKSATGNTILGREEFFPESDSGDSATLNTAVGWVEINGMSVRVVDGPGMVDTRRDDKGKRLDAENKLSAGFVHCPNGFHALLLVLKYGGRFTKEEIETIDILRAMFGPNFIKDHCVLIFTHGDNFDSKYLNEKGEFSKTFTHWLKEQKGELAILIEECGHRAVIFDNRNKLNRDQFLKTLFSFVQKIPCHYTDDMFKNIKAARDALIKRFDSIQMKDHIACDISLLNSMLNPLNGEPDKHVLDRIMERLEDALTKEKSTLAVVKSLKKSIEHARNGQYPMAYQTFQTTEKEGKDKLLTLWKCVKNIVGRILDRLSL